MSVKRRFAPSHQNKAGFNKRICLKNIKPDNNNNNNNNSNGCNNGNNSIVKKICSYKPADNKLSNYCEISTSSEEEDDDDDYHNNSDVDDFDISNELKVKSLRFANSIDSKLSKAVSQYSDDDVDDDEENGQVETNNIGNNRNNEKYDANDNNSSSSSSNNTLVDQLNKKRCSSTNDILNVNYVSGHGLLDNKRYSVNISDVVKSIPLSGNNPTIGDNFHSFNITNKNLKHSGNIPRSDFIARSRCFEYLVGAIDEAWARYCDSTSYDEDLAYGYEDCSQRDEAQQNVAATPNSNTYTSEDDEGYKTEFSATTTVTEYESDFHPNNKMRSFSMIGNSNNNMNFANGNCNTTRRVSEVPENLRLQGLKDRFTKAKYYLEDLVDSDLYNDCLSFWNKWDLIKYSIVDFVEEDEEDDDVERKVDELELGRFAGSYVN